MFSSGTIAASGASEQNITEERKQKLDHLENNGSFHIGLGPFLYEATTTAESNA